jgi:hypothetical protein
MHRAAFLAIVTVGLTVFTQVPVLASSTDSLPTGLRIDLDPNGVSQVFTSPGQWHLETTMKMDITYQGTDPPRWVSISEENVPANPSLSWVNHTIISSFGNRTWTQVSTYTWKPGAFLSGPFQINGHYNSTIIGVPDDWPDDRISFIFAIAISTKTISNQTFRGPVNFNPSSTFASDARYYAPDGQQTLQSFSTQIFGTPAQGYKVQLFLGHEGTTAQYMEHAKILNVVYIPLIALFGFVIVMKTVGLISLDSMRIRLAITYHRRVHRLLKRFSAVKYSDLAVLVTTILVFLPIYELNVQQFVPPWVDYFKTMMTSLFFWFLLYLLVCIPAMLLERQLGTSGV